MIPLDSRSPGTPAHLPSGEQRCGQGGQLQAPTATADTAASLLELGTRLFPGNPQIPSALQAGDSRTLGEPSSELEVAV